MKLEEAKTTFYEASDTLSENVRKLFFAGIAIVWIFKVADKSSAGIAFSRALLIPLGAFIFGLVLDLAQYLYKSTAWWLYYSSKHRQGLADDAEVSPPAVMNALTFILFYIKVLCCAFGFYHLLTYIWFAIAKTS